MSNDIDRLKARALAGDVAALETLSQLAKDAWDADLADWCVRRAIDLDLPTRFYCHDGDIYFGPLSDGALSFWYTSLGPFGLVVEGPVSTVVDIPEDGLPAARSLEAKLVERHARRYLDFYPDDAFAEALRTGHWPADEPIEALVEHRLSMARDFLAGKVPFLPLMCRDVPRLELLPWGLGLLVQSIGRRDALKWLFGGDESECDLTLSDIDPGWPAVGPVVLEVAHSPPPMGTRGAGWLLTEATDDAAALRAAAIEAQRRGDEATARWCALRLIALGEPSRVRVGDEVVEWTASWEADEADWQRTAWCMDPALPRWLESPVRLSLTWDAQRRAGLELEMMRTLLPLHGVQRPESKHDWVHQRMLDPVEARPGRNDWDLTAGVESSLVEAIHRLRIGFDACEYLIAACYGRLYGDATVARLVALRHLLP